MIRASDLSHPKAPNVIPTRPASFLMHPKSFPTCLESRPMPLIIHTLHHSHNLFVTKHKKSFLFGW